MWMFHFAGIIGSAAMPLWHFRVSALLPMDDRGWQWDAFAALGSMGGFMIAAVALLEAGQDKAALSSIKGTPAWRWLVGSLARSMLLWIVAAMAALACWFAPGFALSEAIFLVALPVAVFEGAAAFFAVYWVARRFG
jgi:hypothetical protein